MLSLGGIVRGWRPAGPVLRTTDGRRLKVTISVFVLHFHGRVMMMGLTHRARACNPTPARPQAVITLDYCLVVSPDEGGELAAAFVAELKAKVGGGSWPVHGWLSAAVLQPVDTAFCGAPGRLNHCARHPRPRW